MKDKFRDYTIDEQLKKEKTENMIKALKIIIVVLVLIIVAIIAWFIGKSSAEKKAEETTATTVPVTEAIITDNSAYTPGSYRINTGVEGAGLTLRQEPTKDSTALSTITNGQIITVSEIRENTSAQTTEARYWGRTSFNGYEGWIAMFYTEKTYGNSIVTSVTQPTQVETTVGFTPLTVSEYVPGEYAVNADGGLNIRMTASIESEPIGNIPYGKIVTVSEVFEDESQAKVSYRYWGKVVYGEYTGWISMYYLANLPAEITTVEATTAEMTATTAP